MKFESHFNYETGLIGRAQALYINHSTNYAVPIMIVSFFSILPSIIIRHNVTDIISACCMIICSALVLVTQRKRASIMTANLYKPETTIEANATIDDRFVSVELGNDPLVLNVEVCGQVVSLEIVGQVHHDKSCSVPYLVCKVS